MTSTTWRLAVLAAAFGALSLTAAPSFAHKSGGYSHDGTTTASNPRWMTALPDTKKISELSIPGTHDSMALYGGDSGQTQSLSLSEQLNAGIRYVDIRCFHVGDACKIYHGATSQYASMNDVFAAMQTFLKANPGEAVLMKLNEEDEPTGARDFFLIDLAGHKNTRTFAATVTAYKEMYAGLFYENGVAGNIVNPTLAAVRGKVMIFGTTGFSNSSWVKTDGDAYKYTVIGDHYGKWTARKAELDAAMKGSLDKQYAISLNGAIGAFPYFAASGHTSPGTGTARLATGLTTPAFKSKWPDFPRVECLGALCTIAYEGLNELVWRKLVDAHVVNMPLQKNVRTGIIVMDFPGPLLIQEIVTLNKLDKLGPPRSTQ